MKINPWLYLHGPVFMMELSFRLCAYKYAKAAFNLLNVICCSKQKNRKSVKLYICKAHLFFSFCESCHHFLSSDGKLEITTLRYSHCLHSSMSSLFIDNIIVCV